MSLTEKTGLDKNKKLLVVSLLAWFVINLVQGIFTELFHDEAYFWVFSKHLGLSYFDQMPGIAYWIRAGESILPGEIGVRLLTVLSSVPVLYGIYKLADTNNVKWFIFFTWSVLIIHVAGFLTAPDSVLGLAMVLFLFAYRRWLRFPDIKTSLLLGLAGAFVSYSKYQGIAYIMILFLVNIRKWKTVYFWIPPLVTALFLLPVYFSDPEVMRETLAFHLAGRNGGQSPLQLYGNFIPSQIVVLGPFTFPFIAIAVIRFRSGDFFFSSLRTTVIIYYCLLLAISYHSNVEANWCGPAVPAMIILSIRYWSEKERGWKLARILLSISLLLIFAVRVYLVWDFLPPALTQKLHSENHGWKEWAAKIKSICGDEHVAFSNSYQCASKYWFYSQVPAISTSNSMYRKNQFTIMPMEKEWQNTPAWFAYPYPRTADLPSVTDPYGRTLYFEHYNSFNTYPDLQIKTVNMPTELKAGDTTTVRFLAGEKNGGEKKFVAEKEGVITLGYWWMNAHEEYISSNDTANWNGKMLSSEGISKDIRVAVPAQPGDYLFCPYFIIDRYGFSTNADPVKIKVR